MDSKYVLYVCTCGCHAGPTKYALAGRSVSTPDLRHLTEEPTIYCSQYQLSAVYLMCTVRRLVSLYRNQTIASEVW